MRRGWKYAAPNDWVIVCLKQTSRSSRRCRAVFIHRWSSSQLLSGIMQQSSCSPRPHNPQPRAHSLQPRLRRLHCDPAFKGSKSFLCGNGAAAAVTQSSVRFLTILDCCDGSRRRWSEEHSSSCPAAAKVTTTHQQQQQQQGGAKSALLYDHTHYRAHHAINNRSRAVSSASTLIHSKSRGLQWFSGRGPHEPETWDYLYFYISGFFIFYI